MTVRDELIELRGLRFHYRDWTSTRSDPPTLVLLHGYTGHARTWDHFAEGMRDRYRILALDQRGHGETAWAPPGDYGTTAMVEDLTAFVSALGLERFSLLGLSMGGIVSFAYAGLKPPALERLVIVDIAPELSQPGLARINEGAREKDSFPTREAAFQHARRTNSVPPQDHHRHRVEHALMRTEEGGWTYRFDRALRDPSVPRNRMSADEGWCRVAAIEVPTLLVRGAQSDLLAVEVAQRMVNAIPDASLVEIEGAGHSVPLDKPDGFLLAVRRFLLG